MAASLRPSRAERLSAGVAHLATALVAIALPLAASFAAARLFGPTLQSKYFPWVTGRALGIAGYLALTALVALGLWTRHPWRYNFRRPHGETLLRTHAALGVATVALVLGHLLSLASDSYAGVGWLGAFLPGAARYRPTAVALGTLGFGLMVLVASTARFAGRRGAKHWLAYHRLAVATFGLTWFHAVLAGTDAATLRPLYVITGSVIAVLFVTRWLPGPVRTTGQTSEASR